MPLILVNLVNRVDVVCPLGMQMVTLSFIISQAAAQQSYDAHEPYVAPVVRTVTETVSCNSFSWPLTLLLYYNGLFIGFNVLHHSLQITVTVTQTVRIPTTSDVWVSSVVHHTVPATHLVTQYSYVPIDSSTVTSVIVVTSTPVSTVAICPYRSS